MNTTGSNSKTLDESFRKYAWDYFAIHADHRLRAFHFYILLCTAVMGGFGLLLKNGEFYRWMTAIGLLLIFLSFVFWKLDNRTRQLIKLGEQALRHLDAMHQLPSHDGRPNVLCLFEREFSETAEQKLFPLAAGHFSYARCFRWMYTMFALVGVAIGGACLYYGA